MRLEGGLSSTGPYWEERLSGNGRVLERQRVGSGGEALELARFAYDKLGNVQLIKRYAEPETASGAITWSFVRDTDGNALVSSEPSTAPVFNDFDALGRLVSTTWDDNVGSHEIAYNYDARDRLQQRVEKLNGAALPETLVQYHYDQPSSDPRFAYRVGRLGAAQSFDADGELTMHVEYGYDSLGRVQAVSRTGSDGEAYHEDFVYRLNGQLDSVSLRLAGFSKVLVGSWRVPAVVSVARRFGRRFRRRSVARMGVDLRSNAAVPARRRVAVGLGAYGWRCARLVRLGARRRPDVVCPWRADEGPDLTVGVDDDGLRLRASGW